MINVIVILGGLVSETYLVTTKDAHEVTGRIAEEAEKLFVEKIKQYKEGSSFFPTEEEIAKAVEDGYYYDQNKVEVILTHPEVKYV